MKAMQPSMIWPSGTNQVQAENASPRKVYPNPFRPYIKGLIFLKILGLPLKYEDAQNGRIFVSESKFVKLGILTAGRCRIAAISY